MFFSPSFLCLFLIFIFIFPFADSISFRKTRFVSDDPDIVYQGDAGLNSAEAIELNRVDKQPSQGWAMYANKVRIWDSKSGKLTDFTTHFSFQVDADHSLNYGDGFCFFLVPVHSQIIPNSAGQFLGLFNHTTAKSPQNKIVSVEFDSVVSPAYDPPFTHVGINVNSLTSSVSALWNASSHDGDNGEAWIAYDASTMNLTVSWAYKLTSSPQEKSNLSLQVDLTMVLPEFVMVGFSAATGGAVAAFVLIAGGVDAFAALQRRKNRRRREAAENKTMNLTLINDDLERGAGPRRFLRRDLVSATNNFSADKKLGEGGFGAVYKGCLVDIDIPIAVKKISSRSKQGEKEYITEVKIFSRLRHRNLVKLIGRCHDDGEFMLVYESMPNGSLDSHLFGNKSPLSWAVRHRVALGLASAMLYLHVGSEQCVIHRDIKSSNIMLDSSFNVKLGDFGMARFMDHELDHQTTIAAGTFGYLAPEYVYTRRASKESDVFSFGVVVLEIATGRKSFDPIEMNSEVGLVEWVWDLYGREKLDLAVDKKLQHLDFDKTEVVCLMNVGLWCAHPDHNLRPSIRQAMQVLNFEALAPNLPVKMPAPMYPVPSPPAIPLDSSGQAFLTSSSIDSGR